MNVSGAGKRSSPLERRPPEAATGRATKTEREQAEAEIAGYIAQMTTEMMSLAAKARLDLLAYLLSIARIEAEVVARRGFTDPPVA
jgi:hypothetical protein